ncbi:hypothetical protein EIK77_002615 [Talaromyces pinophilus]|nr:hypothetical protein EIK77_002615 [Talaromyces pinophilus]
MAEYTDVLICGGGPVGLLTGLALVRMGISTVVIGELRQHLHSDIGLTSVDKSHKTKQAKYGRAATVYPRTSEMFDQLDVLEQLVQIGYVSRHYVNYKNGKRSGPGGYNMLLSQMHDTYADFVLNIRQKYVEETVQEAFENQGGNFYEGTELVNFLLDVEDPDFDDYAGTATVKDISHESQRQISL